MDFQSAIEYTKKNPVGFIGTTEGDQPHVRGFMILFADQSGFYFCTSASKPVYRQILKNPKIEVCFYDHEKMDMMRISGKSETVENIQLKKKILEEQKFLRDIFKTADNPDFIIFRLSHGEGQYWNMTIEMGKALVEKFTF